MTSVYEEINMDFYNRTRDDDDDDRCICIRENEDSDCMIIIYSQYIIYIPPIIIKKDEIYHQ